LLDAYGVVRLEASTRVVEAPFFGFCGRIELSVRHSDSALESGITALGNTRALHWIECHLTTATTASREMSRGKALRR
jgi:hypothetical protein